MRFKAWACCWVAVSLALSFLPCARGDDVPPATAFQIQPGSLVRAIQQFSEQSGVSVATRLDLSDYQTDGLVGVLTSDLALEHLVAQHGLTVRSTRQGFVLIEKTSFMPAPSGAIPAPVEASIDPFVPLLPDVIEVQGYRQFLFDSLAAKRDARVILESVDALEIARFPDLNLAETLQRLPGIAISREAGEGRRVSLRGLGPSFTRVELNGMQVAGGIDSPMDSRGQQTRDRAFDFNIFSSDHFNRVEVRKTLSADLTEGGLAGTVQLYPARPLDQSGRDAQVSILGGWNSASEAFSPRLSGAFTQNWSDRFGVAATVFYDRRLTEEQGYNTYRWRRVTGGGSDLSALDASVADQILAGEVWFPRGNRLSVWQGEQTRAALSTSVQWRPSERLELSLDGLYGVFNSDREEWHLASRGAGSTWLGGASRVDGLDYGPSRVTALELNDRHEAVFLAVEDATTASETRVQHTEHDFRQFVARAEWQLTDRVYLDARVGWQRSDYDQPVSDKFYLEGVGEVQSDYRDDRFYGRNQYGWDVLDPNQWRAHEVDRTQFFKATGIDSLQIAFNGDINPAFEWRLGVERRRFANEGARYALENYLLDAFESGALDDTVTPYARPFTAHTDQDWLVVDLDAAFSAYGVDQSGVQRLDGWALEETTWSQYAMLVFDTGLWGARLRGDAGVRWFETDVESITLLEDQALSQRYSEALPSLNLVLEWPSDWVLRASAYRNIARPPLDALNPTANVERRGGNEYVISAGNRDLQPYTSDNLDLSLEWYFSEAGLISVAGFWKSIDGFVGTDRRTGLSPVDLEALGLSLDLPADAMIDSFERPINLESTVLTGVEFAVQGDFTFLPDRFEGWGGVANIAFNNGDLNYASPDQRAQGIELRRALESLSDITANATLYYETERWGGRVSAHYRDAYVSGGAGNGSDDDQRGFNATVYVDASVYAQLTDQIRWSLDAINLTDEREEQYSDSSRRLYNTTTSGVSVYSGLTWQF